MSVPSQQTLARDVAQLIEERGESTAYVAGHDWRHRRLAIRHGFPGDAGATGDPQRAASRPNLRPRVIEKPVLVIWGEQM